MSIGIHNQVKDALANLKECFKWYAKLRNNKNRQYIGQFLDEEGCKNEQYGIYGMSAWLQFTNPIRDHEDITAFRESCKEKLKEWVKISEYKG